MQATRRRFRAVYWTRTVPADWHGEELTATARRAAEKEARAILKNQLPSFWRVHRIDRIR